MSYGRMGYGIGFVLNFLIASAFVAIPLAIWKLIDITIWIWNRVSIVFEKGPQ